MSWKVAISKKASKRAERLPKGAKAALRLLWSDLENRGPQQTVWPNFGKLKGVKNYWHCHLKKGKPTYVACWKSRKFTNEEKLNKNEEGEIIITYAWTHEKAPY